MTRHKPRSGSLAFYPRKRAARELATFRSDNVLSRQKAKPLNFVGYKAGMVHAVAVNKQEKATSFGQQVVIPLTVIECPPLSVFGIRAYTKEQGALRVLGEATVEKPDKFFRKRHPDFKRKSNKKKGGKEGGEKSYATVSDLEKQVDKIVKVKLLCSTRPGLLGFGKKVADVFEVFVGGSVADQWKFAKEKLGKDLSVNEVFEEKQFVDVKAVDAGKGFTGVIKRFGVKMHRRKAKKRRVVGSIGPWNPSTVMRFVARPGQMGYQSRTELNKRLLRISNNPAEINVPHGFEGYGVIKNQFILLGGSTPGPVKRAVALRDPIRVGYKGLFNVAELSVLGVKRKEKEAVAGDEVRAQRIVAKKEAKVEKKSVADEIKEAAMGGGKK